MRIFDDFFPALIFFLIYKFYDIYWATFALIVSSAVQLIYFQLKYKKIDTIYWVTFIFLLLFGGATIVLHDPKFLMWKVSIINWVCGVLFLMSHFFRKSLLEMLIKSHDREKFPAGSLKKINFMWGCFFLFLGTLNIFIAYHYSTTVWVDFKVFGILGLTLIFIILQAFYLQHKFKQKSSTWRQKGKKP